VKIDIVSIFPEIFDALDVSLMGKATASHLVDLSITNLRDFATGVHKSVDDTPYGGGAGMVMTAEVWGHALDPLVKPTSVLIVPTPAGALFNQETAAKLAHADHLIFACGRYEGIDQRVVEHYSEVTTVMELSVGDYVLNGGEVAVLVMLEALVRLDSRIHGQPRVFIRGEPRSGLVGIPLLHQTTPLEGLRCARGPAVWKPRSYSPVAPRAIGGEDSGHAPRLIVGLGSRGKDQGVTVGDHHGVFHMRRARAIHAFECPTVVIGEDFGGVFHQPRFNGEHHPRLELGAAPGFAIVGNGGVFVHGATHAVAAKVSIHLVASTPGHRSDGVGNISQAVSGPRLGDSRC